MSIGYPDIPIKSGDENKFRTQKYVKALSDFILECETPMTIAI